MEVARETPADRLARLAAILEADAPLTRSQRGEIASVLRRIQSQPKLAAAVDGVKMLSSPAPEMAIDFVARRELLSNVRKAREAVASDWAKSPETVEDALTDWRAHAEWTVKELTEQFVGAPRRVRRSKDGSEVVEMWTRAQVLEAISADLLDEWRERRSRRKAR